MIPHKTARGAAALERLKAFEGVPAPYDKVGAAHGAGRWQGSSALKHARRRPLTTLHVRRLFVLT